DWAIVRKGGSPVCVLTLGMTKASDGFGVVVKPGCDAAITRLNFTQWRIDSDQLMLVPSRGNPWRFEEIDPTTWRRVPERADQITLVRQQRRATSIRVGKSEGAWRLDAVERGKNEQGKIDCIQRRRDRYHHHDHGSGAEGASWGRLAVACWPAADLPELRPEFYFCRNLLEQPSSLAARQPRRQRRHHVGQHTPLVLALAHSICDRMDGRESLRGASNRRLWCSAADAGAGLQYSADMHCVEQWRGQNPGQSARSRRQGKTVAVALPGRDRVVVRRPTAWLRCLCAAGVDVVRAGPPNRKVYPAFLTTYISLSPLKLAWPSLPTMM